MFCTASRDERIYVHSRSLSQDLVPAENHSKSPKFPYQHPDISKPNNAMKATRGTMLSLGLCVQTN